MVGVFAPVFYTLIELAVYHSDTTFSSYLRSVMANEHQELISCMFITCSVFVMGLACAVTGYIMKGTSRLPLRAEGRGYTYGCADTLHCGLV